MSRHSEESCWEGSASYTVCPAPNSLHDERVGQHWWSGWPGAYCMKCGGPDPMEMCLADECACVCHSDDYPDTLADEVVDQC